MQFPPWLRVNKLLSDILKAWIGFADILITTTMIKSQIWKRNPHFRLHHHHLKDFWLCFSHQKLLHRQLLHRKLLHRKLLRLRLRAPARKPCFVSCFFLFSIAYVCHPTSILWCVVHKSFYIFFGPLLWSGPCACAKCTNKKKNN